MSVETTKTIRCDMCGAIIDVGDDSVLCNSVISNGYYGVIVHEHNKAYDDGLETGIWQKDLDLCPECADRAAAIHLEITPSEDGFACDYHYSWRDGR